MLRQAVRGATHRCQRRYRSLFRRHSLEGRCQGAFCRWARNILAGVIHLKWWVDKLRTKVLELNFNLEGKIISLEMRIHSLQRLGYKLYQVETKFNQRCLMASLQGIYAYLS